MKYLFHLCMLACALIFFYACGNKPYPQSLILADSLSSDNPDSAIALLKNIEPDMQSMPQATQMHYKLLCIKANDKAYIQHTSDSIILRVLHYYIEQGNKQHLPEAYYYAGRVYRDLGDAPRALNYFEKAVEVLSEEEGYRLKSNIYSQMGTLFAYQGMYSEAIKMYKKGQDYDTILKDSAGTVFNLRDIANMYIALGKQDSALIYFKEADLLSRQLQRTDLFNMIQGQLAALYIDLQEYEYAQPALQNALRDIERPNRSGIYSIAARFYDATNNTDSAVWYYNELLDFGSIYAKRTACRRLLELAIEQNNTKQASVYLRGYFLNVDTIQKLTQMETIHRMYSLYNYQLHEKENMLLKAKNHSIIFWLWVIAVGFIIVLSSLITYRQYNKRKNLELKQQLDKLRAIEKENQENIEFLEKYKSQKEELERSLASMSISDNSYQKKQFGKKIELLNHILQRKKIEKEQEKEAREYLFESDIYKEFLKRTNSADGKAFVTSDEWKQLGVLIPPAFPTFIERLYALHTPNDNELHVCILLKLQFRPADIARLLELRPESISSIRKRLYQKVMGSSGSPEMWDKIISSL